MKISRLVPALMLQIFLGQFSWASESPIGSLILSAPGQPLNSADGQVITRKLLLEQAWHSVLLHGSDLIVDRVLETRTPDWLMAKGKSADDLASFTDSSYKPDGLTLALPDNALFALRIKNDNDEPINFKLGKYPSLVPTGQVMREGWKTAVSLNGTAWVVSTIYEKRPDGVLLAGSMSLIAMNASGQRTVLTPPASGMAFSRQELLWLGDINNDSKLDLILKRVWVTDEIDYVLVVGSVLSSVYVDLDRPYQSFSSGVEESLSISRHMSQQVPLPIGHFGKSAFEISEETWNAALGSPEKNLPRLIADRKLKLGDESIRFTFEYLPRAESQAASSRGAAFLWQGAVLVKVHFRNKTQVLMQAPNLDGGPLRVQVDHINGESAIEISFSPHYNNSFASYWVWNPSQEGRFMRLFTHHSQGC